MIEDCFKNSTRIVKRQANAESKETRKQQHFFHPCTRMQLALRTNIKYRYGNRRSQENGDINQEGAKPTGRRTSG